MSNLIKLVTDNAIFINRIADLLEQEGIPNLIRNKEESARLAGFGMPANSVELLVNKEDESRALKIVEQFKKELAADE